MDLLGYEVRFVCPSCSAVPYALQSLMLCSPLCSALSYVGGTIFGVGVYTCKNKSPTLFINHIGRSIVILLTPSCRSCGLPYFSDTHPTATVRLTNQPGSLLPIHVLAHLHHRSHTGPGPQAFYGCKLRVPSWAPCYDRHYDRHCNPTELHRDRREDPNGLGGSMGRGTGWGRYYNRHGTNPMRPPDRDPSTPTTRESH
jgi:hypothetical protein